MAVPFVQSVSAYSDSGSGGLTVSIAAPSAGNILLAFVSEFDSGATPGGGTPPSGWSYLPGVTWPFNYYGSDWVEAWYKIADGTEGTSLTFGTLASYPKIQFVEYSGNNTSTPFDATCVQTTLAGSGYQNVPNINGITTATANARVVVYCSTQNVGGTHTPPSELTLRNQDNAGTVEFTDSLSDMTQATPGATGTFVYTSPTGYPTYGGVTVAIKQASGGATVNLAGQLSSSSDSTGTLGVSRPLSGLSESTSALSASLGAQRALSGQLSSVSAFSGALRSVRGLAGSITGLSAFAGSLSVISTLVSFAGRLSGTSAFSGTLSVAKRAVSFAGRLSGVSALSGSLHRQVVLKGGLSGLSSLRGTLSVARTFSGTLVGISRLYGALFVRQRTLTPFPGRFASIASTDRLNQVAYEARVSAIGPEGRFFKVTA